jgi:hypothetical protein
MVPVSAPRSVAWQPDPRLALVARHRDVLGSTGTWCAAAGSPPTVAMVRIWPEAPLSTRGSH